MCLVNSPAPRCHSARERYGPDFYLYENNKSMAPAIRAQITAELGVEPFSSNALCPGVAPVVVFGLDGLALFVVVLRVGGGNFLGRIITSIFIPIAGTALTGT